MLWFLYCMRQYLHWLITLHKSILVFRITFNLYCCCCIIAVINDHRVSKINQNLHIFAHGTSLNVCLHSVSVAEVCFSYFVTTYVLKKTALFSLTVHFAFKYFLISDISMEDIKLLLWYNLSLVVFHNTAHVVFTKCMHHVGISFWGFFCIFPSIPMSALKLSSHLLALMLI